MIRFECECGKHVSAADGQAGNPVTCPNCESSLVVPDESTLPEDQVDTDQVEEEDPVEHPSEEFLEIDLENDRLRTIHEFIVNEWDVPLLDVETVNGSISYTMRTGTDRSHAVRIMTTETEDGRPILFLSSRIGTVARPDELSDALLRNSQLFFGRIQMEADNSLHLVHSFLLKSLDLENELLPVLEYICLQSDRIERQMFGVDIH